MTLLDRSVCRDFDRASRLEWLLSNGRGGFAMGTVAGVLSRRYHGLLLAAPESPVHRFVTLAKLDATVHVNGAAFELGVNDYGDVVHPRGDQLLDSFTDQPCPTWRWRAGGALIEQRLAMPEGSDAVVAWFALIEGPDAVEIEVRPLCTSRTYHHLTRRDSQGEPALESRGDGFALRWADRGPALHLSSNARFEGDADWYYNFHLAEESRRGFVEREDLYCPGVFRGTLLRGDASGLIVTAATEPMLYRKAATAATKTERLPDLPYARDALLEPLARATKPFLVARPDGRRTVLAGYPWFGDWGRDTFISLPGLCLVTGRHEQAREILATFAKYIDQGMIPNRFPDDGPTADAQVDYNTVDASLWYVHALGRYFDYTGNAAATESLYSGIHEILTHYANGTRYGIRRDEDGLLACGEPGAQLTWMDAKVGDWVVTPRTGKPVEINALWYNALRVGAGLAERFGHTDDAERWTEEAALCEASFNARFWNAQRECLFDVVDVDHRSDTEDASLRPNQLLAVSLPYAVLSEERTQSVVRVVRERLLTPVGLRTLDRDDPHYRGRYAGDPLSRDGAYHQGTVWPWLLGPMISAWVQAFGNTATARAEARNFLTGLTAHIGDAGIGSVSEIADGDPPHTPGGCPWQAWSVAEPLRALMEDVLAIPAGPKS